MPLLIWWMGRRLCLRTRAARELNGLRAWAYWCTYAQQARCAAGAYQYHFMHIKFRQANACLLCTCYNAAHSRRGVVPTPLYRKCKNAVMGLVRPHSGIYAKRPQGIPRGLLYHACFSSSISRLCWRMIDRRNATSSSSSSTRLFGASVSIMVC